MRAIDGLAHLTLAVDDLDRSTDDYAVLLDSSPASGQDELGQTLGIFQTGNIGLQLRAARRGEVPGLAGIAFRVADISRASETLARCGVAVSDGTLDSQATHGIPMTLTAASAPRAPAGGIALDHIVIRTPAPERAVALYGGRLGLDMRLDRSNPVWNARLMFFRCGDLVVEIAHVLSTGVSDAPDTFGGLSWRVPDLDAAHARLSKNFELSEIRTGRRPGSRVCTVRNRTAGVATILLGVTARG